MSDLIYNVQEIFDASTRRGCLQQHGCSSYNIPPYQRGFKWGSEVNEPVERLLSDLKQAWKKRAKEYLLQAITVKKVRDDRVGWVLEVIDGQQRLTTLFLLICAMNQRLEGAARPNIAEKKLRYSIRHESQTLDELIASWFESDRNTADHFEQLKEAHQVDQESRQDWYYLKCALLRCIHELKISSADLGFQCDKDIADFRDFVFQEVKMMVNAVEAHVSGEVIFGNLNTNRVVLSETELIKGLLLTRVAREPGANRQRHYREILEMRIQLGRKWDELNHWANLPEIGSLYFPAFKDGMMGLLELVARQMMDPFNLSKSPKPDEKLLFEFFLQQTHFEEVFRLLANTFSQMQDWYANEQIYHLLGFCLMHQAPANRLPFLAGQLGCKTKTEFHKGLCRRRKSILLGGHEHNGEVGQVCDVDFGKLEYGEEDGQIKSILLALSVFEGLDDGRFNFHAYEKEGWSLEHIFPQTPYGKGAKLNEAQKQATLAIFIENKEEVLTAKIAAELERLGNAVNDPAREAKIARLLQSAPLLHRIGNLCLLSSEDNSAMGCGMFKEKRRVIRNRIARGSFVPRHTYQVFSKMISGEGDSLDVWSKADIEMHQDKIEKRIRELLEESA